MPDIKVLMLFVQGSRDAFGTEEEIRELIKRLKLNAKLHAIAGGDHSLKAPKSTGVLQDEIQQEAMDFVANWIRA